MSRMANVARATRAIIPTSEALSVLPGRTNAAMATARPSRAYFTRRERISATSTPEEATGLGLLSDICIFFNKKFYTTEGDARIFIATTPATTSQTSHHGTKIEA
jgi:hypothetical protein